MKSPRAYLEDLTTEKTRTSIAWPIVALTNEKYDTVELLDTLVDIAEEHLITKQSRSPEAEIQYLRQRGHFIAWVQLLRDKSK